MEEGTTNQESAMGATICLGAHGEVNAEPEARARATVDPKACVQNTSLLSTPTLS